MRKAALLGLTVAVVAFLMPLLAIGQFKWNFPDRKAIVLDICPHVKITSFAFENAVEGRVSSSRNSFTYQWRNVSTVPILAFQLVTLKYDPFDEPMTGSRILIAGKNSADFSPLQPGEASGDLLQRSNISLPPEFFPLTALSNDDGHVSAVPSRCRFSGLHGIGDGGCP